GLNVSIAAPPDAQGQAVVLEFQTFSVEINRDLIFASFRPACPAEQRHALEPRDIRGWQLQLDFDFLRSRHGFTPNGQIISLFEHDLFGKPVPTFPDHAPEHDGKPAPTFPSMLLELFNPARTAKVPGRAA